MAGRRSKRVKANSSVPVGFIGAGVRFTGDLIDISNTGLLIRCSANGNLGGAGRIGIPVGNETLRAAVLVKRTLPGIGVACEFSAMEMHDRELLRRLMMRLERASG